MTANTDDADDGPPSTPYYNENTFDDIIVQIAGPGIFDLEPTKRGNKSNSMKPTKDGVVDLEENKQSAVNRRRDDYEDDDDEDEDDGAASLNSSDISGDSTISEVSKKEEEARRNYNSYTSKPLVNDDESTIDMRPPAPEASSVSSYVEQLNQFNRSKGRLIKVGVFSTCIAIIVGVIIAVIVTATTTRGGGGGGTVVSTPTNNQVQSTSVGILQPSSAPVQSMMVTSATILPIQLTLQNIPDEPLNVDVRESIIAFINVLLNQNLGESIEILDITDLTVDGGSSGTTRSRNRRHVIARRRLDSTLQLRIVVSGPPYYTEDEMQSLVIQTIDDRSQNIVDFLKSLDSETFQDVTIVVEEGTFDVTGSSSSSSSSTVSTSLSPQTNAPTSEPTMTLIASTTSSPTLSIEVITEVPVTVSPSYRPSNLPSYAPSISPSNIPSQSLSTNLPTPWRNLLKPQPAQPTPPTISALEPIPSPNYEDDVISPYGTATSPYGTATSPVVGSSPAALPPDGSINQGPALLAVVGTSNNNVCANVTYTANWNMLLIFNCSLKCLIHTDCPGGHQCSPSDNC
jgi:hypothetical protein